MCTAFWGGGLHSPHVDLDDVTDAERRGLAISGLLNRYQVIIVRSNGESLYLISSRLCHAVLF